MSAEDAGAQSDPSGARSVANDAMRKAIEVENAHEMEKEQLWNAIERLTERVSELEDRTDLMAATRKAEASSREEKAAICIQTLVNDARDRPEGKQTAWMSAREGKAALGGGVDRTSLYEVYEAAEELVGDEDAVSYIKEPRGADPPSRLQVDLDAGEMPSAVAGHRITTGDSV